MTNTIKFARPEDISQIMSFGFKSFKENMLEDSPCKPDFNLCLATFTHLVINDGVILVKRNAENDKLIDGVFALRVIQPWFSTTKALSSLLFYCKEEKRSFKLARDLLIAAKEYAIINNLPIVFDLFAQKDVQKKIKLLKYIGFREFGTSLVFIPN